VRGDRAAPCTLIAGIRSAATSAETVIALILRAQKGITAMEKADGVVDFSTGDGKGHGFVRSLDR